MESTNVKIKDLRSIPKYNKEELYNRTETIDPILAAMVIPASSGRRSMKRKSSGSLQEAMTTGNSMPMLATKRRGRPSDIESEEVQGKLKKNGALIGSNNETLCQF